LIEFYLLLKVYLQNLFVGFFTKDKKKKFYKNVIKWQDKSVPFYLFPIQGFSIGILIGQTIGQNRWKIEYVLM